MDPNDGFDGYQNQAGTQSAYVGGVRAYILSELPALCSGAQPAGNFVASWSMMTGNSVVYTDYGYAQSGYQYYPDQGDGAENTVFAQWNTCYPGCAPISNFTNTNDPVGYSWQFWTYENSSRYLVMGVHRGSGDVVLLSSDPYTVGSKSDGCGDSGIGPWCSPYGEQYFAESLDRGNDMPGTPTTPALVNYMKTYYDGTWSNRLYETMNGYVDTPNGPDWQESASISFSGTGEPYFSIWTKSP